MERGQETTNAMTIGSLFAGIGGFELAATWAGIEPLWSNEIDPFACKVLTKNFNHEIIQKDIREIGKHNLQPVDIISGGFPCQPFSQAGKRQGTDDDRYLWPEMCRIIKELRPPGLLVKMLLGSSVWKMAKHLKGYSLTWRMKGITTKYLLFQLVPQGPGTAGIGSGLWPTITASDSREMPNKLKTGKIEKTKQGGFKFTRNKDGMSFGTSMREVVKMFPTPTAADTFTGNLKSSQQKEGVNHSINLPQAIHMKMFPTPTASEVRQGWQDRSRGKKGTQESLSTEIIKQQGGREQVKGQLNPPWVEWLMGYPPGWTDVGNTNPKESQE